MPNLWMPYDELPQRVKDNLTEQQWHEAQDHVMADAQTAPETTDYINLKNGQIETIAEGDPVPGSSLPVHNLAGGRGADSAQFHSAPRGARGVP